MQKQSIARAKVFQNTQLQHANVPTFKVETCDL